MRLLTPQQRTEQQHSYKGIFHKSLAVEEKHHASKTHALFFPYIYKDKNSNSADKHPLVHTTRERPVGKSVKVAPIPEHREQRVRDPGTETGRGRPRDGSPAGQFTGQLHFREWPQNTLREHTVATGMGLGERGGCPRE